jgi:cellulose synthase/poly-beta-1,6-N-acetylglucosamine synthase-like glycosyltransferase
MPKKVSAPRNARRRLALILPAHNEELILSATIRSALAAGQQLEDIYVVDDASSDRTRQEALMLLPPQNVLTVAHSGKALALQKAFLYFKIIERYVWVHIADADSVFGPNYFQLYRDKLDAKKYGVAIGFVQSLRGNSVSKYRALGYTYGQQVVRRVQHVLGMVSVFPGPVTCFRTDLLPKLDFDNESLTEDFDITLQFHRKQLGSVCYIPKAVNYTQDPLRFRDFWKQTARWYRGFFQGIKRHKIGSKFQRIDAGIWYQLLEVIMYLAQFLILIPYIIATTGNWWVLPVVVVGDFIVLALMALFATAATRRLSIITALPVFYFLRWSEVIIFTRAFIEVIVLKRYATKAAIGWEVVGRRYQLDDRALKDVAK